MFQQQHGKENAIAEVASSVRYLWRHRPGNEVVAAIQDTIDNLALTTKDGRKPVVCARRKTAHGWHLVLKLPPGISFNKVKRLREFFADATNAWIDMKWEGGNMHMDIHVGQLPTSVAYQWDPEPYPRMSLPVPIGVSQRGLEVFDLAESPHLLVAGVPGFGKSNLLHVLIHSLLPRAFVAVIDFKRLEFAYLKQFAAVTRKEKDGLALMYALNQEMERRIDVLEAAGCVKIQEYSGEMPFIVLVVDEVAEIKSDELLGLVDRIVRLARAVGISVVAATQRPSTTVLPGDTRAMFAGRLCYQVADELNSRMVLGETCNLAAHLPGIKGRGIFKYGLSEREIQTMYLPLDQAQGLLRSLPKRGCINYELPKPKPQTKGLTAR
ncbi:MAG: FtsK/SpoIIIE domain-containing protein [Eubacteriales bacterium]|nr:FtsK/SpoIIIE domain-containing protein [Eubacteriales bacterium]